MQILAHPWVTRYRQRDEDSEPEESEKSLIISEEDEKSDSQKSGLGEGLDAVDFASPYDDVRQANGGDTTNRSNASKPNKRKLRNNFLQEDFTKIEPKFKKSLSLNPYGHKLSNRMQGKPPYVLR